MTGNLYWESPNWRDDKGLVHQPLYKKRWALRPITCADGTRVWLKSYYSYYRLWSTSHFESEDYQHKDFVENITEAEYIVRKLADSL